MDEIKNIIFDLNNKDFDRALKKLKIIPINDSNKNLIPKLFASIYFNKKDWRNSIKYYEKILFFANEKYKIYNNIGVALFQLGKINQSIQAYKKSIQENSSFDIAYNNLGISYHELGNYEDATNNFVCALNINKNSSAKKNLINIFLVNKPRNINSHPLIKINDKINNIDNKINNFDSIKLENIKKIIKKSDDIINNSGEEINFNETQIFRKNSVNLNCNRHFEIFNEFNIIPEYCFNCYKIQINLKNVVDLIKLFFFFDNLYLEKNNIRKCIVEVRPNIIGNYKGYIYCDGLEDAKTNLKIINNLISVINFKKIKIEIKHGCSEFYKPYPDYQTINFDGNQPLQYKKKWHEKELIIDKRKPIRNEIDKKKFTKTLNGINLSDMLIMKNWINYANIINDFSYKEINDTKIIPTFINKILEPQLTFRKQDFLNE